jgi:DNA polymerase beta
MIYKSVNKNHLIEQFKLLAKQISFDIDFTSGKTQMINMFRLKSINTVIKAINNIDKKVITIADLKGVKGIGKGTLERVSEIIDTGKLKEIKITSKNEKYLKNLEELEEVFGIGRKMAYKLFTEHDIKSIGDLKHKLKNGEIDLPENVVKGLKYLDMIQERIPRDEITEVQEYLLEVLYNISLKLFGTVCGSYRRQLSTSGDVDFIIIHSDMITKNDTIKINFLEIFVKKLIESTFIIDSLTGTNVHTKYMGIYKWKKSPLRRIDIRYIPYESYYSATLYFTGPKDFNRKMRQLAINNGYVLNEYGLFKNDKMFKVESEKEIFDLLDLEYVTPDKRN